MAQKRHLFMLTPYLPYPPVSGGRMRTYNLLKHLAPHYDITLVSYGRPEERAFDTSPLQDLVDFHVVPRDASPGTLRAALMSLTAPRAITMTLYGTNPMKQTCARLLAHKPADIIHVESFYMMQNIPLDVTAPIFLSEPAIEYRAWWGHAKVARPWYTRPGIAIEAWKMQRSEPRWWAKADAVGAMSELDRELIQRAAPGATVTLAPNGVDVDFFSTDAAVPRGTHNAVYMGDYKYFPNSDAVVYFAEAILPLILEKRPDFHLTLLGKDPTPEVAALAGDHITVTGLVDDTRPYLRSSAVFVCPLRSGSGTRFKLMEALACGCPVVSTTIGAEGLGATDGEHMLLRDTPQAFADAVLDLLDHPQKGRAMGQAGREWVVAHHAWARSAALLMESYESLLAQRR